MIATLNVADRSAMPDHYPFSIRLRVILIVALSITGILTSGYFLTRHYIKSEMQELSYQHLSIMGESLKTTLPSTKSLAAVPN